MSHLKGAVEGEAATARRYDNYASERRSGAMPPQPAPAEERRAEMPRLIDISDE
ncbi:hypothetical protein [Mesorhizobium sp. BAC0120]|uniref:hypothetical protein n=1 Tax=Mesorhizobium sp. BAC0120 TaxID=3090670 RepID=UPI00298C77F9|nr:hypothetical protein [Mesorhizobium sp. BAC0120]